MKRAFLSLFCALTILAVPLAQAGSKESPMAIDGATTVDVKMAKDLFDKGIPFVDVRSNKDWEAGRIPGATHIELKKVLSPETLGKEVGKDQEVVFYCNGPKCMRSSKATAKAVEWGYQKVYYFRGGFPAWKGAGYPVE